MDFAAIVESIEDERRHGHGVWFYLRAGHELDECHSVRADSEEDARDALSRVGACPDDCEVAAQRRA